MKIIKRDGRVVDYDRQKIVIAIEKANKEVKGEKIATKEDIKSIIKYIENLEKKRMLVEDIQDIIEEQLMKIGKYELAKKYIVYRYNRALVRKSNTIDETILGLIRNENTEEEDSEQNIMIASTQRDCIAGEVSRDLTRRLLLPEKIVKAEQDGVLYFHAANYFVQPIFNCCVVDIEEMLDNGTVINGKMIESPQNFLNACIMMTQIIATVASNQYGGQSIDTKCLGKYLRKSYEKLEKELKEKYREKISEEIIESLIKDKLKEELSIGIQVIQSQLNTLMETNGHKADVTLFLYLEKNDTYIKENAMIIEEILNQRYEGVKNENGICIGTTSPKIIYVLDEENCLKGGKYDYLTKLSIKCFSKGIYLNYISAKKMRENYGGNVLCPCGSGNFLSPMKDEKGKDKFGGRFNQGVVSINLPQIAIISDEDEEKFWKLLDERLELCKEALMCRHYALFGTKSDVSPIHWQYGAISRLKKGEKIDKLLYSNYSTISLGYIGIYETTMLMKGVSHTTQDGHNFAIRVMEYLQNKVNEWKKETNIEFLLYGTPSKSLQYILAKVDREKFGIIKNVTDKGYYTSSFLVDYREEIETLKKLKSESEFQKLSSGGAILYIELSKINRENLEMEEVIKFIYDNVPYVELKQ